MPSRINAQFWQRLEAAKTDSNTPNNVDRNEMRALTSIAENQIESSNMPRGLADDYQAFFDHLGETEYVSSPNDVAGAWGAVNFAGQRRQIDLAIGKLAQYRENNASTIAADPDLSRVNWNSFRRDDWGDSYYLAFSLNDGSEGTGTDPVAAKLQAIVGFDRLELGGIDGQ